MEKEFSVDTVIHHEDPVVYIYCPGSIDPSVSACPSVHVGPLNYVSIVDP